VHAVTVYQMLMSGRRVEKCACDHTILSCLRVSWTVNDNNYYLWSLRVTEHPPQSSALLMNYYYPHPCTKHSTHQSAIVLHTGCMLGSYSCCDVLGNGNTAHVRPAET